MLYPDSGEVHGNLTVQNPATSFPLSVSAAGRYSVWTSLTEGIVRIYRQPNLHIAIAEARQEIALHLDEGSYLVAVGEQVGKFTLNVTSILPRPDVEVAGDFDA